MSIPQRGPNDRPKKKTIGEFTKEIIKPSEKDNEALKEIGIVLLDIKANSLEEAEDSEPPEENIDEW